MQGLRHRLACSRQSHTYAYPDIAVVCGEPRFAENNKDTLINPTVLVEVLSPSTESHDRGLKFHRYRQLESLQEYVLVSQSNRSSKSFAASPRVLATHRIHRPRLRPRISTASIAKSRSPKSTIKSRSPNKGIACGAAGPE